MARQFRIEHSPGRLAASLESAHSTCGPRPLYRTLLFPVCSKRLFVFTQVQPQGAAAAAAVGPGADETKKCHLETEKKQNNNLPVSFCRSARMALPLLRLADLLLTQCGAPRLWPRHPLAAGPKTDPVDCQRLQVRHKEHFYSKNIVIHPDHLTQIRSVTRLPKDVPYRRWRCKLAAFSGFLPASLPRPPQVLTGQTPPSRRQGNRNTT